MSMAEPETTARFLPVSPRLSLGTTRRPDGKRIATLALGVVAFALFLLAVAGYGLVAIWFRTRGSTYVENVFPFWSWSRFLHETTVPARIYDFPLLDAFQHRIGPGYHKHLPFAYPPSFLLLLWPLGLLKINVAYVVFLGVNLAAYIAATWRRGRGRLSTALAALAPSTVLAVIWAQNSLLVAALLFAGSGLVRRRPILAGVLFGLMSFKPQFGLLVPIALISAREWRCFAAASATVLASVVASGYVFGWGTWTAMPAALAGLGHFVASTRFAAASPTVTASLRLLGAGPETVQVGQVLAATLAGATIFWCFRRGFRQLPTAALMVGAFFTTPYAFDYDLPILTCAVMLVCFDAKATHVALRGWEIAVLASAIVLPYMLFFTAPFFTSLHPPYGGIVLVLLFGLIVRRVLVADHRPGLVAAVSPNATVA